MKTIESFNIYKNQLLSRSQNHLTQLFYDTTFNIFYCLLIRFYGNW